MIEKACPVLWRGDQILAFLHPLAGVQLVKGTVEANEAPAEAAVREMAEEAGVAATVLQDLGSTPDIVSGQIWSFFEMSAPNLPDRWEHFCEDDGGHRFAFFWTDAKVLPPPFGNAAAFAAQRRQGGKG